MTGLDNMIRCVVECAEWYAICEFAAERHEEEWTPNNVRYWIIGRIQDAQS